MDDDEAYESWLDECAADDEAAYQAQCDGEAEALAQQEADAVEAESLKAAILVRVDLVAMVVHLDKTEQMLLAWLVLILVLMAQVVRLVIML